MISHPFQGEVLDISYGKWTEVSLQVREITQLEVQELCLWYNSRPTIVKEIGHIHFPVLTRLRLEGNRIESIEGLSRVQMAHIKFLILGENNITSVRVIRKAVWPALQVLTTVQNYFGDGKSLVDGYFPQIYSLYVFSVWGEDRNKLAGQCFAAKMQGSRLQRLCIQKNKFCFSRSANRVLQQRWADARIE